ncbi:MAG: hypothetical protein LCH62_08315 [Proteobacteria bacterium]|nr:hypothetical protein [Pseudomonadota bacterium]
MIRKLIILATCLGPLAACGGGDPVLRGPSPAQLRAVERLSDQDFAVPVPGGQALLMPVFSDKKLIDPHPGIERVVIGVQDPARNAGLEFDRLTRLFADQSSTMTIVPQFLAAQDTDRHRLGPDFARWTLDGWKDGGNSRPAAFADQGALASSFEAIDALLLFLADRQSFPDLKQVALVGFGQTARFVQLYAATAQGLGATERAGIAVRFVVAAADTYVYFDEERPSRDDATGFAEFDRRQCNAFNYWPYGFVLPAPYASASGALARDQARVYAQRDVVYLIGERDSDVGERGCEARAQGRDRPERLTNYLRYLAKLNGAPVETHRRFTAPGVGNDPVALYASPCGRAALSGADKC